MASKKRPVIQTKDQDLQSKLDGIVELKKGIAILKDRMSVAKKELVDYFTQNTNSQNSKFVIDDYTIHYVNKKTTDSVTQKLVIMSLAQYFKSKGVADVNREVSIVMDIIKNQRHSKTIPDIEIKKGNKTAP